MQNILIAAYSDADQRGVVNVILPIQQQEFGIAITEADQPDLANVEEFYQTGTGGFWVARSNDEIVGTVGLKDIGAGQAALRKMFVAAPFRGRELGVAGKLSMPCWRMPAPRASSRFFSAPPDKFLAAHQFYEKKGFRGIAESRPAQDASPSWPSIRNSM